MSLIPWLSSEFVLIPGLSWESVVDPMVVSRVCRGSHGCFGSLSLITLLSWESVVDHNRSLSLIPWLSWESVVDPMVVLGVCRGSHCCLGVLFDHAVVLETCRLEHCCPGSLLLITVLLRKSLIYNQGCCLGKYVVSLMDVLVGVCR